MSKAPLVGGVTLGVLQRGVNGILMEKCRISGEFWNFLAKSRRDIACIRIFCGGRCKNDDKLH